LSPDSEKPRADPFRRREDYRVSRGDIMPSFDLAVRPWIPVRYADGAGGRGEVGLVDLFGRAHEIADIALPVPPAAAGLWRVLYLIAARICGLDDLDAMDDWRMWKRDRSIVLGAGQFERAAIDRYFAVHAGRFDLFHQERPWLQDPRLAGECAKSTGINKLVMGRAAGNNLVWLSHHTDLAPQPVKAAEAAWYLLAWLYYGPSGKITARTVRGQTESNMTAGPLRSRISFHPLAQNLFCSLVTGIPYLEPTLGLRAPDAAPWEDDLPDPLGLPPSRQGVSGPLTGQFRHALLLTASADSSHVTDARITWAWRQPTPERRDPYLIYDTPKDSGVPYARYARLDRAVWRDLDALLLQDTGSGRTRRPAVFDRLPDESVTGKMRVRAYGFDQDGQVRDRQWFTASTPPVLIARDTGDEQPSYEDAPLIGVAREAAERVGDDLGTALRRAWAALADPDGKRKVRGKDPDPPWLASALGRYWRDAERVFWEMTEHQRPFDYPSNTFIRVALAAYDQVTETYGMRRPGVVVRALERARGGVFATWSPVQSAFPEANDA
jgi:CRISPR system Cascade subunit CasA